MGFAPNFPCCGHLKSVPMFLFPREEIGL